MKTLYYCSAPNEDAPGRFAVHHIFNDDDGLVRRDTLFYNLSEETAEALVDALDRAFHEEIQ